MAGWLRRNWIPTAGMVVAVAFVAWLAWINLRGGGSGGAVGVPTALASPSAVGSASPSADPAEAQVEAAAKRWVQAYMDTYRNGSASEVDALELSGSQALGEAGAPLAFMNQQHKTFLVSNLACSQVTVSVAPPSATADITCTATGEDASWPELKPLSSRTTPLHFALGFELIGTMWLVDTQH